MCGLCSKAKGVFNLGQGTADQNHRSSAHGDVRARAESNSKVGLRQRGRIVHSIADQGNPLAGPLQFLNDPRLRCGRSFGCEIVHTNLFSHNRGGRPRIAGHKLHADAAIAQPLHHLRGSGLDLIAKTKQSAHRPIPRKERHRAPCLLPLLSAPIRIAVHVAAGFRHQLTVPYRHAPSADKPADSFPFVNLYSASLGSAHAKIACVFHHGPPSRCSE